MDNSPHSYVFQPENAMPIGTFIDEKDDVELLDILPILLDLVDVRFWQSPLRDVDAPPLCHSSSGTDCGLTDFSAALRIRGSNGLMTRACNASAHHRWRMLGNTSLRGSMRFMQSSGEAADGAGHDGSGGVGALLRSCC